MKFHSKSLARFGRRLGVSALCVALAGSVLAGCSTAAGETAKSSVSGAISAKPIDSLNWSLGSAADSLDIARSFTSSTGLLSSLGYDTLVVLDHNMQIAPWIATMTEKSPTVYEFDLRPGIKFWDGTPLTTDDVVWSYTRHMDPATASHAGSLLATVASVAATGSSQVTFTLTQPDPTFKYSASIIQIFNHAQGTKAGSAFGSPAAIPLGTGQYVLTNYTTGGGITGTLNPYYWGKKPTVKKITVSVIQNPETARIAIQQGASSGMFDVPNGQLAQWQGTPGVRTGTASGLSPLALRFPVNVAPFNDLNVRKALAYCLDRAGIVKALYGGAAEVASSIATRGHWLGVMSNKEVDQFLATLPSYSFNLDKAKAALKASHTPNGFTADIVIQAGDDATTRAAASLAANAKKIGITLNVKGVSQNELEQDYLLAPGKKQALTIRTTSPTYPDPTDMLVPFLDSDPNVGYLNASGYSNSEVDSLIHASYSATGSERLQMLEKIATIAQDELPVAPIAWVDSTVGLRKDYNLNNFDAFTYYRPWLQDLGTPSK